MANSRAKMQRVLVIYSEYLPDQDSILLVVECEKGKLRQQLHSSCFRFGERDKEQEMIKLAKLFRGKYINVLHDSEKEMKDSSIILP